MPARTPALLILSSHNSQLLSPAQGWNLVRFSTQLNSTQQNQHFGWACCSQTCQNHLVKRMLVLNTRLAPAASHALTMHACTMHALTMHARRLKHQIGVWAQGAFCGGSLVSQSVVLTAAHCFGDIKSVAYLEFTAGECCALETLRGMFATPSAVRTCTWQLCWVVFWKAGKMWTK